MKRIKNVKMLTDNKFLNMYELEAVKLNGDTFPYYFASRGRGEELKIRTLENHPEGICIYGLYGEKHDKIVLVREFRFPLNDYVYALPAGLVERGEDPEICGIREFEEETGLTLAPFHGTAEEYKAPFYSSCGLTDESITMVYGFAEGTPNQRMMEDTEDITTILADREEVKRILREEKVDMKFALLMMNFLHAKEDDPFAFLTI